MQPLLGNKKGNIMRKPQTKRDWELFRAILETELGLKNIEKDNLKYAIYFLQHAINSITKAMYEEKEQK
jgi:hypothetical protein